MRRLGFLLIGLLLVFAFAVPVASAESKSKVTTLTLQQAINLALQNDKGLQKAEKEIDRTKELRDNAADNVDFTPVMGSSYDPNYELSWNNLLSADLAWQMSKKNLEASRDAVVLKTCKSYWDVQAAKEKVAVQQKLEQQALLNLQNARAGLQAGTIAPSAIVAAEGQWQQAKNNLEAAQHALDDAYNSFNQQVGLDASERPVLADAPTYEPLDIADLDHEVARVVASSPSVWLAQQKVTLEQWAADMMFFTGQYTPYKAREIAVDQAQLDAASAQELMEMVTRQLYYTTKSLEEAYQAAQEALKMAQENLRVTQVKYNAGMATKSDIVAAEVAVNQAQLNLGDLIRQHAYMKLAFEKPWAASGGSGGSTSTSSGSNS
ncbi:outer membrane protein [Moorella thermoacetica Y72]|uniref:Outer membrane protein n=1 Tax=Moorella thermoacetica Y72 TaxID=1325331 RepID=A0A0S6UA26_NEOTH|nr:TolC family protein [Moorella thermoacetica]GAF25573.1 outer membrane protein [Moorella thermoacetica Y72]